MSESESYPFEHAIYRPGLNVYVNPAIRDIHPLSPIAGQVVQTTTGIAYVQKYSDGMVAEDDLQKQLSCVPVIAKDGSEWLVEEEYIQAD